jgi:competence ComEA-like helix-hairpin-helix protein
MTTAKPGRFWAVVALLLIVIIVVGGVIAWQKYSPNHPIKITLLEETNAIGEVSQLNPQKIDINRAEAWLLEALPGIGPVKAQAIIDYRQQNGGFSDISEILHVPGIGKTIYEKIKDLITVGD